MGYSYYYYHIPTPCYTLTPHSLPLISIHTLTLPPPSSQYTLDLTPHSLPSLSPPHLNTHWTSHLTPSPHSLPPHLNTHWPSHLTPSPHSLPPHLNTHWPSHLTPSPHPSIISIHTLKPHIFDTHPVARKIKLSLDSPNNVTNLYRNYDCRASLHGENRIHFLAAGWKKRPQGPGKEEAHHSRLSTVYWHLCYTF